MNIEIEKVNPVQAKLKVLVPAADVNARLDSYFQRLAKQAKIPGFRPGKAPKDVVKKYYSSESASEFSERLISEYVYHAVQEKDLHLVMPPVLVATDLPQENKDFRFEVEIDLKPELPQINLQGLELQKKTPTPASDEEVNAEIERLRESEANFIDIKEERPANANDCVVVQYEGKVDGKSSDQMKADTQTIILGQKQFLPDFEAGIVGMKIGEEKDFSVNFPESYGDSGVAGKMAEFHLKLLNIKEKTLPPLDDEFAKSVDPEISTLEALRTKIRESLLKRKSEAEEEKLRTKIGDLLVDRHSFPVSERQVAAVAERLAKQAHHMMHEMGVQHEESEDHFQSLMEASRKKAERDVKLSYILEAIAKEQKIEMTPEDLQKRFEETAKRTGLSLSQIKSYYTTKDEESGETRMERLRADILDEKSLDYALSQATIKIEG